MDRIRGSDLAGALHGLLDDYSEDLRKKVDELSEKAVKDIEQETKSTAPIGHTGKYRKAITSGVKEERRTGRVYAWYVKAPHYRLTHLLVHGHAKRNGGRTRGNPFLSDAVNKVLPEYEKAVEDAAKETT